MFLHDFENVRHQNSFGMCAGVGTSEFRGLLVPLLSLVERGSTVGTTNIDLGAPISRQHAPKSLLVDIGFALHLPLIQNGTRAHFLAPNAVRSSTALRRAVGDRWCLQYRQGRLGVAPKVTPVGSRLIDSIAAVKRPAGPQKRSASTSNK